MGREVHRIRTDTNSFTGFDVERYVVENNWPICGVPRRKILHTKVAASWPVSWWNTFLRGLWFLLDGHIGLNTLKTRLVTLQLQSL